MRKRHCNSSPKSLSRVSKAHDMDMDVLLQAVPGFSDPSLVSSSLDRFLDSRSSDAEKNQMIESVLRFGSLLQEAARKSSRRRASLHNSLSWPLPPELTVKVFSHLDTQSLCHAAATCSMFNKCAMDPLCYANIDLTSAVPKINNTVVSTMIQRAGKNLQSLKLGILPGPTVTAGISQHIVHSFKNNIPVYKPVFSWNDKRSRQGKDSCVLTRSCLVCLSRDCGTAGSLLRRLHLYNIDRMDSAALCTVLSSCPFLLDLEVVGLHVELSQTLESLGANCHLLERLYFVSSKTGRDGSLRIPNCVALVNGCPNLTSLALRGFKLQDCKIHVFFKGFQKLKFVDFSTSCSVTGAFLSNLGNGTNGQLLEVLILRDCMHLKEVEVVRFLSAVLSGDCKFLRYLDISNKEGLASEEDWFKRCVHPSILVLRVLEERPEICLLAEYPLEESFIEIDSDDSGHSKCCQTSESDGSSSMNSYDGSYSSDQGTGNEDSHDINNAIYGDSSDEVDFLIM